MSEKITIITPPASRPVTWAEAKAHLRIDGDTEQSLVESYIDAATDYATGMMERSLMIRTIQVTFEQDELINLPYCPLVEIVSVVDADDDDITACDVFRVGRSVRLQLRESATYPLIVTYTAGHATAAEIPAAIRIAILQHVATLYQQRESVADKSLSIVPHALDAFYRLHGRATGAA